MIKMALEKHTQICFKVTCYTCDKLLIASLLTIPKNKQIKSLPQKRRGGKKKTYKLTKEGKMVSNCIK